MEKTHAGITYELVKQAKIQPPPLCCDGCEIQAECYEFRECTEPRNLDKVWKIKKQPEENGRI